MVVEAVEIEKTLSEKTKMCAIEAVDNQYAWKKYETSAVKAVDIQTTSENITVRQLKQLMFHTPSVQQ